MTLTVFRGVGDRDQCVAESRRNKSYDHQDRSAHARAPQRDPIIWHEIQDKTEATIAREQTSSRQSLLGRPAVSAIKQAALRADRREMAAEQLPDIDELLADLARLERDEKDLSDVRRRLHDRIDLGFPNEVTLGRERQVSEDRRQLHCRIDELRIQLAPFLGRRA